MRRISFVLLTAFIWPGSTLAADLPRGKSGLWEISTKLGNGEWEKFKFCVDEATATTFFGSSERSDNPQCSKDEVTVTDNQRTNDSVCTNSAGQTITDHTVTTWTNDTAYRAEGKTSIDPGHHTLRTTSKAKWIAACPPGINPGDVIGPDGKPHNFNTLPKVFL